MQTSIGFMELCKVGYFTTLKDFGRLYLKPEWWPRKWIGKQLDIQFLNAAISLLYGPSYSIKNAILKKNKKGDILQNIHCDSRSTKAAFNNGNISRNVKIKLRQRRYWEVSCYKDITWSLFFPRGNAPKHTIDLFPYGPASSCVTETMITSQITILSGDCYHRGTMFTGLNTIYEDIDELKLFISLEGRITKDDSLAQHWPHKDLSR